MGWFVLAAMVVLAVGAAWWLGRRGYRLDDDAVFRTLPSWLLPLLCAVAGVLAAPFWVGRALPVMITYAVALVWAAVLAFIDLDVRRLPDVLTLPAYPVFGLALAGCSAVTGDWAALGRAGICAAIGLGLFALPFVIGLFAQGTAFGLGDVKLAGSLGGLLGWISYPNTILGLVAGTLLGLLVAVVLLVVKRASRTSHVSYGPFLIVGAYLGAALPPFG